MEWLQQFISDPKVLQQFQIIQNIYWEGVWDTLYALVLQTLFAYVIGLPRPWMALLRLEREHRRLHAHPLSG